MVTRTQVFSNSSQARVIPKVNLFGLRKSHQLHQYMSWKAEPLSWGREAPQSPWVNKLIQILNVKSKYFEFK